VPGAKDSAAAKRVANAYLAAILAWALPGAGHAYLRRWRRALAFMLLVLASLAIGCLLEGHLSWTFHGAPLDVLATFGGLGSGAPSILLHLRGYTGTIEAPDYEYGTVFILTAGLMNMLLILDAWDIASGRKS
jgi:Family of unknown function (DUF6677)